MKTKNYKGITLIALVVTIIVLLILAGVSVSVLIGGNGILSKAGDAVKDTAQAQLEEEVNVMVMRRTTGSYLGETQDLGYYLEQIEGATISKITEDAWYVTRNGAEVTVYDDGTVETGKYDIWDGTSIECPLIVEGENGVFNWYIYTAAQLKFLADFTNNGRQLTGDAGDLTSYVTEDVTMTEYTVVYLMNNIDLGARQTNGEWAADTEWTPIGKTSTNMLVATFEGNGNTIRGVYINTDTNFNGIFGNANTIQNLTVKDSYIKGDGYCNGGIVGALRSGNMENCHNINTTVISNNDSAGGVCGQFGGTKITNCSNSGTVIISENNSSSYAQVGGIVGYFISGTITNCTNTGTVTGEGRATGGVVGYAYTSSTIEGCTNSGSVTGKGNDTGGVVGLAYTSSTVESCTNSGLVAGKGNYTGGVVGYAYTSSIIESCSNSGTVTGEGQATGGVVGLAYTSSTIESCSNSGTVTGEGGLTGGVVGYAYKSTTITGCSNSGSVTGEGQATGGVLGYAHTSSTITNCRNSGSIIGQDEATGGIAGAAAYIVTECSNTGNITGTQSVGGITGDYITGYQQQISKCYNSGSIQGTNYIGGISGWIGDTGTDVATMTQCYNKGTVTGTSEVGTIIGYADYDTEVTSCYYYTEDDALVGIGALGDGGTITLEELRKGTISTKEDFTTYDEFITWIENL